MINEPTGQKLDHELENSLIARAQNGDTEARNALIEHHYPFIRMVARKSLHPADDVEQYLSHAVEAFIKGVNGFDHARGLRLVTYCHRAILQAVRDARWRDQVVVPPSLRTFKNLSPESKAAGNRTTNPASLDYTTRDGWHPFVAAAEPEHDRRDQREWLQWATRRLNARQKAILDLRMRGWKLETIAESIGSSRQRVHQILKEATDKLQQLAAT